MPDLAIHPNPASESITLTSDKPLGLIRIEVSDELGVARIYTTRIVKSSTESIDIHTLPSGKYYLHITSDKFVTTLALVVSR